MRFLHEEGYVLDEVRLPKIRCPATTIKPLSHNEVKRVLRAFDTNRFTDLRNRTIVHLLIDTGCTGHVPAFGQRGQDRWREAITPYAKALVRAVIHREWRRPL